MTRLLPGLSVIFIVVCISLAAHSLHSGFGQSTFDSFGQNANSLDGEGSVESYELVIQPERAPQAFKKNSDNSDIFKNGLPSEETKADTLDAFSEAIIPEEFTESLAGLIAEKGVEKESWPPGGSIFGAYGLQATEGVKMDYLHFGREDGKGPGNYSAGSAAPISGAHSGGGGGGGPALGGDSEDTGIPSQIFEDDENIVTIPNIAAYEPASTPSPVPEPATLFLFGVGLLGMSRLGHKKLSHKK